MPLAVMYCKDIYLHADRRRIRLKLRDITESPLSHNVLHIVVNYFSVIHTRDDL